MVAEGIMAEHEALVPGAIPLPVKAKKAAPVSSPLQSPLKPVAGPMTTLQKIRLIEEAIQDLRPHLQADGGDCELIDVDGDTVMVKLTGACVGCQMSAATISGVQERLVARLGIPLRVVPVASH
jgi:NifU-like protein